MYSFIDTNLCIPCSPDGEELQECCNIIDYRKNELALLYESWEGKFMVGSLRVPIVEGALQELGMISSAKRLPWAMVIDRVGTVSAMYEDDEIKALERAKQLLRCIEEKCLDASDSPPPEELFRIPFLPVLQKPQDYPQELAWKGSGKSLLSASEVLAYSTKQHLIAGSMACIVSNKTPPEGGCGKI